MRPDDSNDEQAFPSRPSSWSAALQQLPGLMSERPPSIPRPTGGRAREVISPMEDDLAGDDEPEQ